MTLSVSGATTAVNPPTDDTVTVTHFSLDSWGQIEQKTTPLTPKVSNQSQNPFNPFTNDTGNDASNTLDATEEDTKPEDDKKTNTNPFIDSNPFLGILNPFKELQSVTTEKKIEADTEKVGARVVKTEEIQTTTTTLTHKVSYIPHACKLATMSRLLCNNVSPRTRYS